MPLIIGKTPKVKEENYDPFYKPGYWVNEDGKFMKWASKDDITDYCFRQYYKIPYDDKDEAKKYGIKWDKVEKLWYLPSINYSEFNKQYLSKYEKRETQIQKDIKHHIEKYNIGTWFWFKEEASQQPIPDKIPGKDSCYIYQQPSYY
jgi:hypothetical protein